MVKYKVAMRHVLWLHVKADPEKLRALLPPGLALLLVGGSAWLSYAFAKMSRFRMKDVRIPKLSGLCLHVRTYVQEDATGEHVVYLLKAFSGWHTRAFKVVHLGGPPPARADLSLNKRGTDASIQYEMLAGQASFSCSIRPGEGVPFNKLPDPELEILLNGLTQIESWFDGGSGDHS